MKLFNRLFRSTAEKSAAIQRLPGRFRARLSLEGLETRLAPANVLVVPMSQLADASHFHTLAQAIAAAAVNGMVTIEPGASADPVLPVVVNVGEITIQGDPNVPANILPTYQLSVQADLVTLQNLKISSVVLGTAAGDVVSADTVEHCLINTLTSHVAGSVFSQNTFTGSATFDQVGNVHGGDVIANNTFTGTVGGLLTLNNCLGTHVTQNTFFDDGVGNAIDLNNCGNGDPTVPAIVADNSITLTGSPGGVAIFVTQNGAGFSSVRILNNSFNTGGTGIGMLMAMTDGDAAHYSASVEGNDFHNNAIGVLITGDGTHAGNIDMGGGSLGSKGGNNFRSFTANATNSKGAISIGFTQSGSVMAMSNMFGNNITPSNVVFLTQAANPNLSGSLSTPQSFIQAMYNELLGRSGSLAELNGWVPVLTAQGQAAVANDILRSSESLGRVVDQLYLRFLGRQSDPGGRAAWINALQNGSTLDAVEAGFLTSPEYLHHIDTDYVQSLYINLLGRTGGSDELASWYSQIQTLGLAGIANGFLTSQEYRGDSVSGDIATFLHRPATATEVGNLIATQTDLLGLEAAVLSTQEYFTNG
jgi:hypothetical protein